MEQHAQIWEHKLDGHFVKEEDRTVNPAEHVEWLEAQGGQGSSPVQRDDVESWFYEPF